MNIFTYGTLMIPSVMHAVTGRHFRSQPATLKGYARFTVKGVSYPGIVPAADASTGGILYFDVDETSLAQLDRFEGALYRRTPVAVEGKTEEKMDADAYVVKFKYRRCLSSKTWDVKEFAENDLDAFLTTFSGFSKNG